MSQMVGQPAKTTICVLLDHNSKTLATLLEAPPGLGTKLKPSLPTLWGWKESLMTFTVHSLLE